MTSVTWLERRFGASFATFRSAAAHGFETSHGDIEAQALQGRSQPTGNSCSSRLQAWPNLLGTI